MQHQPQQLPRTKLQQPNRWADPQQPQHQRPQQQQQQPSTQQSQTPRRVEIAVLGLPVQSQPFPISFEREEDAKQRKLAQQQAELLPS